MTNLVKRPWLLLSLSVMVLQSSWGQAPSGMNVIAFTTPSTAVYDLSGIYTFNQDILSASGTTEPLSINGVVLIHDRSGRLHGTGEILVAIGADSAVAARYVANGHVSGGGNRATRVQLTITLTGKDMVAGVYTGFNISVHYNLTVNPNTMALEGPAKGHASFAKLSGGKIDSQNFMLPLQPGVDGTWSAQLDIVALNRLGGSGNLVLSNGRMVPVKLSGSFSSGTGLSNVHCTGLPGEDGRGSAVQIGFLAGAGTATTAKGTILGQKVLQ